MRDRERQRQRQRHTQREKQAPYREPNVGLDPWSPGSRPGLKTALNRWATQASPNFHYFIFLKILFIHKRHTRERQRHRQREKQAPCREPNVGLDPWSPGSHPGLKVALNGRATQAALHLKHFHNFQLVF